VVAKNLDENLLLVVQGDHALRYSSSLEATDCSWIGDPPDALINGQPFVCNAKIRYRQDDQQCTLLLHDEDRLLVTFDAAQTAIAPGQFVVFYAGEQCLGGAVIDRTISADDLLRKTG
jgi:tRNA-specific 2-thiouridylase